MQIPAFSLQLSLSRWIIASIIVVLHFVVHTVLLHFTMLPICIAHVQDLIITNSS